MNADSQNPTFNQSHHHLQHFCPQMSFAHHMKRKHTQQTKLHTLNDTQVFKYQNTHGIYHGFLFL